MATTKPQGPVIGDGSLHIGDRVVYPNQGICRITGVETKQIAGQQWEVVTLSREEDGATVMVPRAKVMGIGLRKVADRDTIEQVFDTLAAPGDGPELDWKVRHRENADRMSGGGLFGTVDVLKSLHSLARVRPLPQKERELYDNARHLLIGEIAAASNIPLHVAEDNLDYALWPPEGMKRKGKLLPAATLGPPTPVPRGADDEDLGFDDEETEEERTPAAAEAGETDEGDEDDAPAKKPPAKKAAPKPAAKKAALAPVPESDEDEEEPPVPAAAKKPAPEKKAPAEKKPAAPEPAAKKPAPEKKPAAEPAAKKAAPEKKPAAAARAKPAPAAKKPAAAAKRAPPAKKPAAAKSKGKK